MVVLQSFLVIVDNLNLNEICQLVYLTILSTARFQNSYVLKSKKI